jgi:hypothetical protein
MSFYAGTKSLDAEITLNFENKELLMDYSLNSSGDPYSSNNTVIINDEFENLPRWEQRKQNLFGILKIWGIIPILLVIMPTVTFLTENKWFKSPERHYKYQKFLKYLLSNTTGVYEQKKSGELGGSVVEFIMPNNVWFEYQLEGEYQEKIKNISLKRNLITHLKFGKYRRQKQKGWKVIFEFASPPTNGFVKILHTVGLS